MVITAVGIVTYALRVRMRMMYEISECKRKNLCIDCDNTRCHFHGKKEADCPKWKCDRPGGRDCEHCEFIDEFIEQMRRINNE